MQLGPVRIRQLFQNSSLVVLIEVFQNVDRIIRIEIAQTFGDDFRRQVFQNLQTHCLIDLGQRGIVEVLAQKPDKGRPILRIQRLEKVTGVGFVKIGGKVSQAILIVRLDCRFNSRNEFAIEMLILVAHRNVGNGRGGDIKLGCFTHLAPPLKTQRTLPAKGTGHSSPDLAFAAAKRHRKSETGPQT